MDDTEKVKKLILHLQATVEINDMLLTDSFAFRSPELFARIKKETDQCRQRVEELKLQMEGK